MTDTESVIDALGTAPVEETRWRAGAVTSQVLRAVTSVGLLACLARLAMGGRDIALASRFGAGNVVDAFVIALVIPLFAVQIVSGFIPSALIPTFKIVESRDGKAAANRLVGGTLTVNVFVIGFTALLIATTAPITLRVIASGFPQAKLHLTESLQLALLPMFVLSGVSYVYAAVLNAHERFALAATTPAFAPFAAFLALVAAPDSFGIHGVAWAMSLGAACEAVVLAVALSRLGISPLPRWGGFDEHLRAVVFQYVPAIGGALLMSSTVIVDQAVAAARAPGSVSALNYGGKMVSLVAGIAAVAIGTVLLQHLSMIGARADWAGFRATLRSYTFLALAVSVPITVILIALSHPLVVLLFQHGAFTARDSHVVSHVQAMYLIQIPFYLVVIIGARSLAALRRNSALLWISGVMVIVNLVTDLAFVRWFGVSGIALSTSAVYVTFSIVVLLTVERNIRRNEQAALDLPI
jgi:putative peptidoglycan lipid II flippase